MNKYFLFFTIISLPMFVHSMFVPVKRLCTGTIYRSIWSRSLSGVRDTLRFIKDPQNSLIDKCDELERRWAQEEMLSKEEREALKIVHKIIDPLPVDPQLLHTIVNLNDNYLLKIALSYGLSEHIEVKDFFNCTPLYVASVRGYTNLVDTLLANKADVNSKNRYQRTPLIGIAAQLYEPYALENASSFTSIIKSLKKAGSDIHIADRGKNTAHDYVVKGLQDLENQKKHTVSNEHQDVVVLYKHVQKLLQE